jgi:phage FluMu gp28-like protein
MDYEQYGFKPIKYRNAEDALAFHMPPYTSTIISKPGTSAIRGGKKDMYYDEAAHIKEFRRLYQAGLPAITRGEGRLTVVSTPLGQSGLFYELWSQPSFSKHLVPWWESRFMVRGGLDASDPYGEVIAEAMAQAPDMATGDRVDKFGSDKIKEIFYTGLRGDTVTFQTEYECMFVDETEAYFPMDLIYSCTDDKLPLFKDYPSAYVPEGDISIGVDLAKEIDKSVFTVVDNIELPDNSYLKKVIYIYSTQDDYDVQFNELKSLALRSDARRVTIDAGGPGQMFYERSRKEGLAPGVAVEGISFTNAKKEKWATTFKGDLQTGKVVFPSHRELLAQIHGIRRTKTENGFFKFAGKKDDFFWSMVLGLYGEGRRPVQFHTLR